MAVTINTEKFIEWLKEQRGIAAANAKLNAKHERYGFAAEDLAQRELYDWFISALTFALPGEIDWIEGA